MSRTSYQIERRERRYCGLNQKSEMSRNHVLAEDRVNSSKEGFE